MDALEFSREDAKPLRYFGIGVFLESEARDKGEASKGGKVSWGQSHFDMLELDGYVSRWLSTSEPTFPQGS